MPVVGIGGIFFWQNADTCSSLLLMLVRHFVSLEAEIQKSSIIAAWIMEDIALRKCYCVASNNDPPRKISIEILAIFEKVSPNLRKQNHICGSLNEVLTTR